MKLFEDIAEDKKYLALEGTEYGVNIDPMRETEFITLLEAEKQYKEFFDEDGYGAGGIFIITNNSIKCLKSECNL
jgi:hypothetical protein